MVIAMWSSFGKVVNNSCSYSAGSRISSCSLRYCCWNNVLTGRGVISECGWSDDSLLGFSSSMIAVQLQ
uniref:Uncharacterized protein n=1 Tax=Physcomitrium patens TaxID=3218 RepID=A0A2K1IHX1_PHYPA|nr:hypothetical protein PHYPA_027568 [Physcomitrium patens]